MRKSIATVCLSGTLSDKLKACATAGFDGVEIFENDLITSRDTPAVVAERAADLGLTVDLYQPFRDFEGVTADRFAHNLRRATAKFTLMRDLGADTILVCSNVDSASIPTDELAAEQLRALAERAADHGIRIAYEALAWGKYVSDFEHAYRIVELADHHALGVCLDSFHVLSRGWDPEPIESLPAEKILFCQVADAPRLSMDILSWSRHHRVFPGEGSWDLPGFMTHVVRSGYDGPVSLEVFNDIFRQISPERTAIDAIRSLIWLEDRVAARLSAEDDHLDSQHGQSRRMTVNVLPAVDQPTGINFAEVRAAQPLRMETTLTQLGFRSDGRHRNKPVQLWTEGGARVILNEQEPRAEKPALSAIGFDVSDPASAYSRSLLLKAAPVPRESQADEEVLQVVAAPDSTEIFLCQGSPDGRPAWTDEFGAAGARPGTTDTNTGLKSGEPGHISHIDHINLSQPWQHFDEAILFYLSTLSLTTHPSSDVAAPNGLVRSQVIQSDDGAVRIALNVAPLAFEAPESSKAEIYPGHIAFATDDLIAAAASARDRGLQLLAIPPNYYDDLDARLNIPPQLLATLQELNLLYDRDGHGEFLHFYTPTIGAVFFEVVERRGGYEGYGAPDASIRLASQYQHSRQV